MTAIAIMTGEDVNLEEHLLQRAKSGDRDAFIRLVTCFDPALRTMVRYVVAPDDIDDVLQQSYLNAYRAIPRFSWRGPGSVRRWMATIAVNVARETRRSQLRWNTLPLSDLDGDERADPDAQRAAIGRLDARALLADLPREDAVLLLMAYVIGLSYAEIGAALAIPPGTVASRLHNARRTASAQITRIDSGEQA
jgi:RNA polymerase sigma-70 factor (ECF subfamily)